MNKLVFFFPTRNVGGVGMLFVRLVKQLNLSNLAEAYMVDYPNGYSTRYLESNQIIIYDKSGTILPDDSVVIFQHSTVYRLEEHLVGRNLRCLFWCLHVNNALLQIPFVTDIIRQYPHSICFKLFIKLPPVAESYINWSKFILEKSGLIFMEEHQKMFMSKFDSEGQFNKGNIVPIFYPLLEQEALPPNKGDNIVWLGRLVDFKIPALMSLLGELESMDNSRILYVIGDGDKREYLEKYCRRLKTKVEFLGTINSEDLGRIIELNHIGYGLAMGTSILELLNLGLRVIGCNVSYSNSSFPGYLSPKDYLHTLGLYGDKIKHKSFINLINEEYSMHDELVGYYGAHALEEIILNSQNTKLYYNEVKKFPRKLSKMYKVLNYLRSHV